MILYGSLTSPYVRHCRVALEQGGLKCQFQETDYSASASLSPTKRVPLLQDGDRSLTDSSVIVRHFREASGLSFLPEVTDFEWYCLCNTAMDTTVNLFFLERDGVVSSGGDYLERQANRLTSSLNELETLAESIMSDQLDLMLDSHLRLVCFLEWALFRKRIDLSDRPNLQRLLNVAVGDAIFASTRPPAA